LLCKGYDAWAVGVNELEVFLGANSEGGYVMVMGEGKTLYSIDSESSDLPHAQSKALASGPLGIRRGTLAHTKVNILLLAVADKLECIEWSDEPQTASSVPPL
jgi:hypothetical protein